MDSNTVRFKPLLRDLSVVVLTVQFGSCLSVTLWQPYAHQQIWRLHIKTTRSVAMAVKGKNIHRQDRSKSVVQSINNYWHKDIRRRIHTMPDKHTTKRLNTTAMGLHLCYLRRPNPHTAWSSHR